jgi:hypothetical protein
VFLPSNKTTIAATKLNAANPTIRLKNPKVTSMIKTNGPTVAINLPAPSTMPEHVERISVGKFSAV